MFTQVHLIHKVPVRVRVPVHVCRIHKAPIESCTEAFQKIHHGTYKIQDGGDHSAILDLDAKVQKRDFFKN